MDVPEFDLDDYLVEKSVTRFGDALGPVVRQMVLPFLDKYRNEIRQVLKEAREFPPTPKS